MKKIRVLLIDDHRVMRAGLRALLESTGRIEVVGEVSSGEEGVAEAERLEPDVAVMDLAMPGIGGIPAIRQVTALDLDTRVLVLTMHDEEDRLARAIEAGAAGYLNKSVADTDVIVGTPTFRAVPPRFSLAAKAAAPRRRPGWTSCRRGNARRSSCSPADSPPARRPRGCSSVRRRSRATWRARGASWA